MASAASPRAANSKILESPASTTHVSSSYACAQDEYFKHPHKTSTDGDKRLDSGWILVGFGIGGRLTCHWLDGASLTHRACVYWLWQLPHDETPQPLSA
jgi:hypothetical protein